MGQGLGAKSWFSFKWVLAYLRCDVIYQNVVHIQFLETLIKQTKTSPQLRILGQNSLFKCGGYCIESGWKTEWQNSTTKSWSHLIKWKPICISVVQRRGKGRSFSEQHPQGQPQRNGRSQSTVSRCLLKVIAAIVSEKRTVKILFFMANYQRAKGYEHQWYK